jgi:uncharacterized protein with NRDE domain
MCLILFAYRYHPRYPLIVAANRDEFYDRPAAPASFWETAPPILAGRDLLCGGTWFGITGEGRFAAVVNYRDPDSRKIDAPSRGNLVTEFLLSHAPPGEFLDMVKKNAGLYSGFTLLFGDPGHLFCFSNQGETSPLVQPGIHGLSNHLLDTPWPKVVRGKDQLKQLLSDDKEPAVEDLFDLLTDRSLPEDHHLPDTGVGLEKERLLAPLFICGTGYGTRSSTVLTIGQDGAVSFTERTWNGAPDHGTTVSHRFLIKK